MSHNPNQDEAFDEDRIDEIDIPELSEDTFAELRRRNGVSDETLQRLYDKVLGSTEPSSPTQH